MYINISYVHKYFIKFHKDGYIDLNALGYTLFSLDQIYEWKIYWPSIKYI